MSCNDEAVDAWFPRSICFYYRFNFVEGIKQVSYAYVTVSLCNFCLCKAVFHSDYLRNTNYSNKMAYFLIGLRMPYHANWPYDIELFACVCIRIRLYVYEIVIAKKRLSGR